MNNKTSKVLRLFGIIFLVFAVICAILLSRYIIVSTRKVPTIPSFNGNGTNDGNDIHPENNQAITPEYQYESPVDFEYLKEYNEDIFAWLDIPGSEISQPVLYSPWFDDYYLDHGPDGNYSEDGALFIQASRNDTDFSKNKCSIIYGHKMLSGAMFGTLQVFFSDPDNFAEHNELIMYYPDRMIKYKVFAAVPYDNRHVLISYDFDESWSYMDFIDSVYSSRELGANLDKTVEFDGTDNLLILSTCLRGNLNRRYLVCGIEVKES